MENTSFGFVSQDGDPGAFSFIDSGSEAEEMRVQLTNILSQFQALTSVDTEDVEPTGHTTNVHSIMRIDEPHPPLEREDVLQNAPDRDGEFMRVRPVLE